MPADRPYPDIASDGFEFHPHVSDVRPGGGESGTGDWEVIAMIDNGANRRGDGSLYYPGRMDSHAQDEGARK